MPLRVHRKLSLPTNVVSTLIQQIRNISNVFFNYNIAYIHRMTAEKEIKLSTPITFNEVGSLGKMRKKYMYLKIRGEGKLVCVLS